MKIFILNPPIYGKKKSLMNVRKRQPLSLAYIASLLREKYIIKFLDANVLDMSIEHTIEVVKRNRPDVLILTSTPVDRYECPNSYIDSVFEIINLTEIENTVLIGSHGTVTPEWVFQKSNVKYIVRGEPEIVVFNLINALHNKADIRNIKGISFKVNNQIIHNEASPRIENLDSLPFPAYDLLPMDKYRYSFGDLPSPFSIMLTSRGCPFQCVFCLKAMFPEKYITRSPRSVIEEARYLIEEFNIKSIFFQDWEFTVDKNRVKEICDLILENNLNFRWGCNARANDLSEELVRKMKKAGCVRINIGFESANQRILDNLKKRIKVQDIVRAIEICKNNGIIIGLYGFLNAPGEDRQTIKNTINFLKKYNIKDVYLNFPIPYPGTDLFEYLKAQKKNKNFTWDNIEKYAGKVKVKYPPISAKILQQYYKFTSKFISN